MANIMIPRQDGRSTYDEVDFSHPMPVGGNSIIITPTLAVTTSAYGAGNVVGGILTLTGALRASSAGGPGTGLIQSLLILDRANQKPALDILLFNASPAGTFTDKVAFPSLTLADTQKIIRRISIAASDYVTLGGVAIATVSAISKVIQSASASADLYAVMITSSTPTFAATTDLIVRFGILRD